MSVLYGFFTLQEIATQFPVKQKPSGRMRTRAKGNCCFRSRARREGSEGGTLYYEKNLLLFSSDM